MSDDTNCKRCGSAKHRGRCKGGGKAVTRQPKAEVAPEPITITASLEIAAGLGFRASIEESALVIEQDRVADDGETYTHTITLASHEADRIVDWIASQVGTSA